MANLFSGLGSIFKGKSGNSDFGSVLTGILDERKAAEAKKKEDERIAGIAEDPRFGMAGKELHTFLQKRKKAAAPGIAADKKKRGRIDSQRAEMEKRQKAMGSILTSKSESPSLLG